MEWADIFLFPADTGIFSIKCRIEGDTDFSRLSDFIFLLREKTIPCIKTADGSAELTSTDLISDHILHENEVDLFRGSFSTNSFNNKLKTYCIAEADLPTDDDEGRNACSELLYEMGTVSPIGSASRDTDYSPDPEYMGSVMSDNSFSVFRNWKALSLFDTFTVLFNKTQPHTTGSAFSNFENLYFPIYIQNLFLKYLCFNLNARFSRKGLRGRAAARIRNEFLRIKNRFLFSHISYNFLPNSIHEHIRKSLDLAAEIEQLEDKIESINTYITEQNDRRTNIILGILSVLSIGSTFFDTSEWVQKLFAIPAESYQLLSLSLVSGTVLLCLWLFVLFTRKR